MDAVGQTTIPQSNQFLSEAQAAAKLGISRPTLVRLRQARRITCLRIANKVLYRPEFIDEFLSYALIERKAA